MKNIYVYLQYPRLMFADILYRRYKCEELDGDMLAFLPKSKKHLMEKKRKFALNYLLLTNVAFRTVFYFRMPKKGLLRVLSILLISPPGWIELGTNGGEIGGGFRFLHKASVVVFPYSAGKNLTVAQGVTIGVNIGSAKNVGSPVIGDNVFIGANSVVIGDISIGDNVTIGAGSVVTKSIPSDCIVAGNPAKIIKHK